MERRGVASVGSPYSQQGLALVSCAPLAAPLPADGAPQADPEAVSSGSPFGSQLPVSRTGGAEPTQARRVVMDFPAKSDDLLLSGMPNEGRALARKALIVDVPNGRGHMVLYTMRPFWRWQPQGSYFQGFNAILNWDHLDAGAPARPVSAAQPVP